MIYIGIIQTPQMVAVPRSDGHAERPGLMTLVLTRGGAETRFEGLLNTETDSLYYVFEIGDASRLAVGEYDYRLLNDRGDELSCGIMTAGDYVRTYDTPAETRKIIEYGG